VDAAKAGLDQAETRYRQGLGNIIELTDAEVQLEVAQSGLVQSRFDANVSRAQLDYAVGALKAP
jgi:outer membrane protein TolC